MKKNTISTLLFSFFFAAILTAQSNVKVFTNVNILPMDKKEVLKNQTVIVTDGIITTIRPNEKAKAKIPKNAEVIDGKGSYMMPGLSDMHAHLPGENGDKFDTEKYLALQLASGVTTVRAMRDEPNLVALRDKIRSGAVTGPNLYLSAVLPLQKEPTINKIKLETLIEGYKKQGYEQIKYLSGGTDEQLKDISTICQKNGLRFVGHAPKGSFEQGINLKMASVEHVAPLIGAYKLGETKFNEITQAAINNKVFLCPTLDWYYINYNQWSEATLRKRAGMDYVPSEVMEIWNKDLKESMDNKETYTKNQADGKTIIANASKSMLAFLGKGGKLLIGGDDGMFVVPGYSVIEEIRAFSKAGFSNYETLRAATYNAADFFGETEKWGSIRKGKQANFILVAGNPLENLENLTKVEGVQLGEKWNSKATLLEKAK